jgi:hypothetical protein
LLFDLLKSFVADHSVFVRFDTNKQRNYLPSGIHCPPFIESALISRIRIGYPGIPLNVHEVKLYWTEEKFVIRAIYKKDEAVGPEFGFTIYGLLYVDIEVYQRGFEPIWVNKAFVDLYEESPYYVA